MLTLLSMLLLPTLITAILWTLGFTITLKQIPDREKPSPYECGFEPNKKARLPFSLRFFTLTIIFLIFDIEIAILLPLGIINHLVSLSHLTLIGLIVIAVLTLGLLHEWKMGVLSWLT